MQPEDTHEPFSMAVSARLQREGPEGYFPASARYERHVGDISYTDPQAAAEMGLVFERILRLAGEDSKRYGPYLLVAPMPPRAISSSNS